MKTLPTAKVTESLKQLFVETFRESIEPIKTIEQFKCLLFQLGVEKEKLDDYLSVFDWKILDDKDRRTPLVFEISASEKDNFDVEKHNWKSVMLHMADVINNHTIVDINGNNIAKRFLERTHETRFIIERAEIEGTNRANATECILLNYGKVNKLITPLCDPRRKEYITTIDTPFVIGGKHFSMNVNIWAGSKYTIKLYPYAEFKIPDTKTPKEVKKPVIQNIENVKMPIICGEDEFVEIMIPSVENEKGALEVPLVIPIAPISTKDVELFAPLAENGWGTISGDFVYNNLWHIAMIRLEYSEEVIQTLSICISRNINGEKTEKHYKISDYLDKDSMTLEICILKFKSPIPFDGNTMLTISGHKGKLFKLLLFTVKPNGLWADFDERFKIAEPLSVDEQREQMIKKFTQAKTSGEWHEEEVDLGINLEDHDEFVKRNREHNLKLLGRI